MLLRPLLASRYRTFSTMPNPAIVKPLLDLRQYRHITLPNKLEALLISDPQTDKSAAALDVRVGSLFDPPQWQGLAHFLEHMLFLGTTKYPSEDEYQSYLAKNGGMSNAFTADNHTCYFFNVSPDHLEGALDRFGQFFVSLSSPRAPQIARLMLYTANILRMSRKISGDSTS